MRERERDPLVWEREISLRDKEFETSGSNFEQNWEIESRSMSNERWAKMAMLNRGVRERFDSFGKEREREREREDILVELGKFFFWVCDCVRKCLIKCYFD